jgi:hypothetical protein
MVNIMGKKGTTFWDVIKEFLAFLWTKKKEKKEEEEQVAQEIKEDLKEGYQKIDEEKEEQKEKEDLDNVQDDLNSMF